MERQFTKQGQGLHRSSKHKISKPDPGGAKQCPSKKRKTDTSRKKVKAKDYVVYSVETQAEMSLDQLREYILFSRQRISERTSIDEMNCHLKKIDKLFFKYPFKREIIGDLLAEFSFADVFMDSFEKILNDQIKWNDEVQTFASLIYEIFWNFSDASKQLSQCLAESGVILILINRLANSTEQNDQNDTFINMASINILNNISRFNQTHCHFCDYKTVETLKKLVTSQDEEFRVCVIFTLINITEKVDIENIISKLDFISTLQKMIDKSFIDKFIRKERCIFSTYELLHCLKTLLVKQCIIKELLDQRTIEVLTTIQQQENKKEVRDMASECLRILKEPREENASDCFQTKSAVERSLMETDDQMTNLAKKNPVMTKEDKYKALLTSFQKAWRIIEEKTEVKLMLKGKLITWKESRVEIIFFVCEAATHIIRTSPDFDTLTELTSLAIIMQLFVSNLIDTEQMQVKSVKNSLKEMLKLLDQAVISPFDLSLENYQDCIDKFLKILEEIEFLTEIEINANNVTCALFGLDKSFEDKLSDVDLDICNHEYVIYFITTWMECRYKELKQDRVSFENLGFTQERSRLLELHQDQNIANTENVLYWAISYIEHLFWTHPLLIQCTSIFLPEKCQTGENKTNWVNKNVKTKNDEDREVKFCRTRSDTEWTNETVEDYFGKQDNTLLFHGTSEEFVDNILLKGIDLDKGKMGKDFSNKGFYVSDNFEAARLWSKNKFLKNNYAVIVFQVPNTSLETQNNKGLDLSADLAEWKEVVSYFRSGKNKQISDSNLKDKVDDASFIKGQILKNVPAFLHGSHDPIFYQLNGKDVIQICLKKDDMAEKFDKYIAAVVFYHT